MGRGVLILVTVGTMLPFDRLVRAADRWAAEHTGEKVYAQIGERGGYEPQHMAWSRLLSPAAFADLLDQSRLLVAHAGTGSYFLAADRARPIVLLPRRAAYREHTTDHQVGTAQWLATKPGVQVAMTEDDLPRAIEAALAQPGAVVSRVSAYAPELFIARIRAALLC